MKYNPTDDIKQLKMCDIQYEYNPNNYSIKLIGYKKNVMYYGTTKKAQYKTTIIKNASINDAIDLFLNED